jgi:hypothetical protein
VIRKHSDCEIDLKILDYSTRCRTELADEPACPACVRQMRTGENRPGWQTRIQISDKPTAAPERRKLATAFARRDSNQTGDPKLFRAIRISRFEPDRARAGRGGTRGCTACWSKSANQISWSNSYLSQWPRKNRRRRAQRRRAQWARWAAQAQPAELHPWSRQNLP